MRHGGTCVLAFSWIYTTPKSTTVEVQDEPDEAAAAAAGEEIDGVGIYSYSSCLCHTVVILLLYVVCRWSTYRITRKRSPQSILLYGVDVIYFKIKSMIWNYCERKVNKMLFVQRHWRCKCDCFSYDRSPTLTPRSKRQ